MALGRGGSWDQLITAFERDVWPTMQSHGFRKDNAFQAFMLNRVANLLHDVLCIDPLSEANDEEPKPWEQ